ncbi:T9SS type A sorting domain-containing protein [Flavobacterium amnicola]|uniref:T9SS type A sorting domain-containing protein n=1 Tax=Flavobacterium amnicola TaxID=2506422 RepID=A0A4Q1K4U2_9FLAO|nr:T9SS type A sorting domain-containing protein [Flavobacterium amnicola]RXR20587.1 T9SS type A sorting domain-containing protein [Flavobacterium amnicola]
MNLKLLLLLTSLTCFSQTPIFNSSMSITSDGSTNSPSGEEVDKIIDGSTATKFLDFDYSDGLAFIVNTGSASITDGIRITTANDSEGRDPMNFEVLGSNDGTSFTSIASNTIPCITDRFFERTFTFSNSTSYSYYKIVFTDQCFSENSLQLAEVQLIGSSLSTSDFSYTNKINVYPNPSTGIFNINIDTNATIEIYDLIGKQITSKKIEVGISQIDMGNYNAGIYLLKVTNENNQSKTMKIVKQ